MIESIHIKNFRGIQDGKIDRFSKINLLVGPNNSGKTAILEAIYLTNTTSTKATFESYGFRYEAFSPGKDLLGKDPLETICAKHLKQPTTNDIVGSIFTIWYPTTFTLHVPKLPEGEQCKVAVCSIDEKTHAVIDRQEKKSLADFITPSFGFDDAASSQDELLTTLFWERPLTHYQDGQASWLTKGCYPSATTTFFYDISQSLSHLPFEFFRKMLNVVPGWTHKIAKSLERIFQLQQKFNVTFLQLQHDSSRTQGFIAPEDKVALTIDDYGDGARSAFKLLTPLIALAELADQEGTGVFLWEEPELFQNPQSLGKLLAEVVELIKDKPIQLFIATHSIEVVAQFVRLVNESAINAEDLLAIRLNLQDGKLASSAFNHEEIQRWTSMNLDLRVPSGEVDSPLRFQFKESVNAADED